MRKTAAVLTIAAALVGASGVVDAAPGPNGKNNHGLCTAYFNGSETGRQHKRKAPPFAALEAAAEAQDQTVEEYCAGLVGGRAGKGS